VARSNTVSSYSSAKEVRLAEGSGRQPEPVARAEDDAFRELGLEIARQHLRFEFLEGLLAAQGVVSGRERASGHRRDHVHLVEQAALHAVHLHLGAAQLFEDAVAQRRGARAAAGEGEDHQQVVGLARAGLLAEAVTRRAGLLQLRRRRPVGAAGREHAKRH
jgi:hypothetical protein